MTATVVGRTTRPAGILNGFCYVYTLTDLDHVGNTVSIKTTVKVPRALAVTGTNPNARGSGAGPGARNVTAGSDFQSGVTASIDDSDYTVNSVTFVDSGYQAEPPHGSQSPPLVRAGSTPSNGCRKLPLSGGADLPGRDQDLLDW